MGAASGKGEATLGPGTVHKPIAGLQEVPELLDAVSRRHAELSDVFSAVETDLAAQASAVVSNALTCEEIGTFACRNTDAVLVLRGKIATHLGVETHNIKLVNVHGAILDDRTP